jgi:hypothetical protein
MKLTVVLLPFIWHRCGTKAAIQSPVLACYVMSYHAAFFGRVIPSAVQKRLVNFLVSCVRRSGLRCSGIHAWMSRTCWMIALNFMDPFAIQLGSIGYSCGLVLMILNRMKGSCCVLVFSSSQATGCGLGSASSCRVPALDVRPKKWFDEWLQHLTTWGTGFWCNSSSATLYRFFLIKKESANKETCDNERDRVKFFCLTAELVSGIISGLFNGLLLIIIIFTTCSWHIVLVVATMYQVLWSSMLLFWYEYLVLATRQLQPLTHTALGSKQQSYDSNDVSWRVALP